MQRSIWDLAPWHVVSLAQITDKIKTKTKTKKYHMQNLLSIFLNINFYLFVFKKNSTDDFNA